MHIESGERRQGGSEKDKKKTHTHSQIPCLTHKADLTVEQRKRETVVSGCRSHTRRALGRISRYKIHLGAVTGPNTFVSD